MKAKSVLAQEMWGKLKQQDKDYWFVARRLRGRTFCIERYPKPSYTRTSAQDEQRNKFKNAVNAWNALSPSEKEQWNKDAEPFGLTGYQYFIQQYLLAPPPAEIWYKVTIDNTANSNTLTDYQILINIQNDEQFFNDCQDKREAIRLFDTDKSTSLSYWIEQWDTANHNAKIWVKVPSIPGSSTKTIYISVDPNRTTDNSNATDVFITFLDKNDAGNWTTEGLVSVTAEGEELRIHQPATTTSGYAQRSISTSETKYIFEQKIRILDPGAANKKQCYYTLRDSADNTGTAEWEGRDDNQDAFWYYNGGTAYVLYDPGTFDYTVIRKDVIDEDNKKTDFYALDPDDYSVLASATDKAFLSSSYTSLDHITISDGTSYEGAFDIRITWIRIRKFADPEPSISYEKETS